MLHLAIFSKGFIEKILSGRKTIDGRFSQIQCMPYHTIEQNDLVFMKKSGGPVVGYFVAGKIQSFENLKQERIKEIVKKYEYELNLSEEFLKTKLNSRYLTLIEIKQPTKFRVPIIVKKRNLLGWISLGGKSESQIQLF
jgi:hypothetical protein